MNTVSGGKIDWISENYNLPIEKLYQFEFPSEFRVSKK